MSVQPELSADQLVAPVAVRGQRVVGADQGPRGMAGLVLVVLALAVAVAAPWVAGLDGNDPFTYHSNTLAGDGSPKGAFGGVSADHWFGVEPLTGRDLFSIVVSALARRSWSGSSATISRWSACWSASARRYFGGWYDRVAQPASRLPLRVPAARLHDCPGHLRPGRLPALAAADPGAIGVFGWPASRGWSAASR